jgi:hypothetical protein
VPIDSDPDEPDRARDIPAVPDRRAAADRQLAANGRTRPDGEGGPDAPASPEARASHEALGDPEARDSQEAPGDPEARVIREIRGGGEADDGTGAAEFRQRQLDAHARYRRDVDAVYQAHEARQAWAEAVPQLRQSWAEHQEKYPERSVAPPRTHPDASWSAAGGRVLTPEQNAEASKARADLRDEADQVILPAMHRVESASPHGTLAGLEHMLKGEDRLKEKIADELLAKPAKSVREAMHEVPDAVRFTLSYPAERYAEGVATDVDQLKAEGFELIKLKNLWHTEQYKGINSQWRRPDNGTRFEMQFHTPESLEAKELTHKAYERIRGSDTSPAEQRELKAFQRRVNAVLVTPPGTADIKDFPEKKSG